MSIATKNRRKHSRYPVSRDRDAWIEFHYPGQGGQAYQLPVVNVSASGLSFGFEGDEELSTLEAGTQIEDVVVHMGGCVLRGELLVMHVTADADSGYVCGALYYPATDTDLVKLKSVIAGMEVAGTD